MPLPTPTLRQTSEPTDSTQDLVDAGALRQALAGHGYLRHTQVVDGIGALPDTVQAHLLQQGLDFSKVKGVFSKGVSYVVATNLENIADGVKTALHEVVGHEGLRALLGNRFEPVMLNLYQTFPREHEAWETTARRYGYLDTGTEAGQVAFAEELTAHMAESHPEMGEFDMIKAEIRAQLREQLPDLPMEEWEVRALIQRSRESLILRHGSPDAIVEVEERLALRERAVSIIQESNIREGKGVPDPLSLALYRQGSRVVDADGIPTRLYHGAGSDVSKINGTFWGSTNPAPANEYAELRASMGRPASVVPFYADIRRPFDGDALNGIRSTPETPNGLSVQVFVEKMIAQSGLEDVMAEGLREMAKDLRALGRREESGPTYSPHDFWYETYMSFGRDGAALLQDIYATAGFDGVRYTELGSVSYGAFSQAQLHFIDQGATLRGWQPDRHHGQGDMTQRPEFRQWFGDSKAVDDAGKPLVVYHGTGSDFTMFGTGRGAIYTTPDAAVASEYALAAEYEHEGNATANVMPVYLSLKKPLVLDEAWAIENMDADGGDRDWGAMDNALFEAADAGYDGAILRGIVDYSGAVKVDGEFIREEQPYDQYIVFTSEQIKSAIGNQGSFDPNSPDIRYAISAYHGSPHAFDRFDLSKVGVGEGNQVFGHGLYFSSMEAVASAYMHAGQGTRLKVDGRSLVAPDNLAVAKQDPMFSRALNYLSMARDSTLAIEMATDDGRQDVAKQLVEMLSAGRITKIAPGNLYEVTLTPNEDELLDWDAAIGDQSPEVKASLAAVGFSLVRDPQRHSPDRPLSGKDIYRELVLNAHDQTFDRAGPLWESVKDDPNRLNYSMDAIASRYLAAIGIPGLRYFDGDSRVAGNGSHNYVLFDDSLVSIKDVRYAMAAAEAGFVDDNAANDAVITPTAFERWFDKSAVVDSDGKPLVVYHGADKAGFTVFNTDGKGRSEGTGAFFTQSRLGASSYSGTTDDAELFDRDELLAHPDKYDVTIEIDDDGDYLASNDEGQGIGPTLEDALNDLADELEDALSNNAGVYPVYLSLQDPMVVDARGAHWEAIVMDWQILDEDGDLIDFIHDPDDIEEYLAANPGHTVEEGAAVSTNDLAREAREMECDGLIIRNVTDEGPHGQGYGWDDVIYVAFNPHQVKSIYNVGSYDPANDDIRYSLAPKPITAAPSSNAAAFDRWFDNSTVVERDGKPMAVYHGSPDIRGVIAKGFEPSPTRGEVYFFTNSYAVADTYADDSRAWDYQNAEPMTAPFYLSLKNPYVVDANGGKWRETEKHIKEAKALGHDGIVIRNSRDEYNHTGNGGQLSTVYAVFDPEQIASAEPHRTLYSRIDGKELGSLSVLDRANERAQSLARMVPESGYAQGITADPYTRLSFAGESALTHDPLALESARKAITAGVDAEIVRRETGWFQGDDQKWRFEIDDSAATVDFEALQAGVSGWQRSARLGDFLDHPKLYAAYPDLADVEVVTTREPGFSSYSYAMNMISLDQSLSESIERYSSDGEAFENIRLQIANLENQDVEKIGREGYQQSLTSNYPEDQYASAAEAIEDQRQFRDQRLVELRARLAAMRPAGIEAALKKVTSVVLHEIAHGIQAREGFASGGSPMAMSDTRAKRRKLQDAFIIKVLVKSNGGMDNALEVFRQRFERAPERGAVAIADDSAIELAELRSQVDSLSALSPNERYLALAGEVEARNVQERMTMTPEERLAQSPFDTQDIDSEDVIVIMNGEEISARGVANVSTPTAFQSVMPLAENPSKTEAFKKWFGESRVVDEKGNPKVVYKGMYPYDWESETPDNPNGNEITGIKRGAPLPAFNGDEPGIDVAGFFGDADTANHFASLGLSGAVYPVYLSLQNPYVVDAEGELAGNIQFGSSGKAFREAMRSGRYDGAILHNTSDEGTVYITTRAEQAKSVYNSGAYNPTDPDMRLSFAGESALTAPRLQLRNAKQAISAGVKPELVREQTGWFQGPDQQWRFEIDDSNAVLLPALTMLDQGARGKTSIRAFEYHVLEGNRYSVTLTPENATNTTDFIQLVDIDRDILEGLLPASVVASIDAGEGVDEWGGELPEAGLKVHQAFTFAGVGQLALDQVMDHPALFAAYPILREVAIKVDPRLGTAASFNTAKDDDSRFIIKLGRYQQRTSLIHEIQHCLQVIEGFAQGGSIKDLTLPSHSMLMDQARAPFDEQIRAISLSPEYQSWIAEEQRKAGTYISPRTGRETPARSADITLEANSRFGIEALEEERKRTLLAINAEGGEGAFFNDRYTAYLRLAGEVEARNVQARLNMSAVERKARAPSETQDVATENLIVRMPETEYADARATPRLSFAGESARSAPRLQLRYAKQAIAAGIKPEIVRQQTGWEQGGDGAWRFEISDHDAKLRYGEDTSSNPDVYMDWIEEAQSRERGVLLSRVLNHPALFEAYPELKAYRLVVADSRVMPGALAQCDAPNRTITMVDPYELPLKVTGVDPALSVLIHEIQHGVQRIEGFATGGSVQQIRNDLGSIPKRAVIEDAEYMLANAGGFDSIDDFVSYMPCANFDVWQDASIFLAKNPDRLAERRRQLDDYDNAPETYHRLAGEVESRNVQTRIPLTPEERQQTPPAVTEDVARPDQRVVVERQREGTKAALSDGVTLQAVDAEGRCVVNHTQAGENLQSSAAEMIDVLDACGLDYGWQDGGCRIFAEALNAWSDGAIELGVTARESGTGSHAVGVLALPGSPGVTILLDSDGVATAEELSQKLALLELSQADHLVAFGDRASPLLEGLPMDDSAVCYTVRALSMHLGEFEKWQAGLAREMEALMPSPETQRGRHATVTATSRFANDSPHI